MWRAPLSFVFCRENRSFLTKKLAEGCSFAEGRCSGGSLTGTDVGSARTPLFGTTDKRKRPWQNAKASSMCGLDFPVFEVVRSGEELAFREPALCSSNLAGDNPVQIEANQGLQRPLDFATSLTPEPRQWPRPPPAHHEATSAASYISPPFRCPISFPCIA